MSRLLVMIASISLALLTISSTCIAGPVDNGRAASSSFVLASSADGLASPWPSSEAPSQIVGGGLLSL